MTRVCHVISGYIRDNARVFQRQCVSLYNNGYDVLILTNDGEPDEIISGIKIISCKRKWKSRLKVLLFAKRQFLNEAIRINADIYQLHSPELISLGLKLKALGKVVVYDAHEDLPRHILEKEWLPNVFRKPVSYIVEKYMNYSLSRYNEIISPHLHVIENIRSINKNVTLITNFPILNLKKDISEIDYFNRNRLICYTGTVYEYSNQESILKAISQIPDICYEVVGFISDNHHDKLKRIAGYNKANYRSLIPFSEMKEFYTKPIIGIVIYDYKLNLGYKLGSYGTNKIFEYMEAGLPIICTDYILWKEIVEKYNCGICVEPRNSDQIKNAIEFLLLNSQVAYQMGQNGRKAIIEEYNWGIEEKKYINIFEKYSK